MQKATKYTALGSCFLLIGVFLFDRNKVLSIIAILGGAILLKIGLFGGKFYGYSGGLLYDKNEGKRTTVYPKEL